MSAENVRLVRQVFDGINRGDLGAVLGAYHPDAEMVTATSGLDHGAGYRGHDGIRRFFESFPNVWDELRLSPDEFRSLDSGVLVVGHWRSRGRRSGADVQTPVAWRFWIRDGKIAVSRAYRDAEDALADSAAP